MSFGGSDKDWKAYGGGTQRPHRKRYRVRRSKRRQGESIVDADGEEDRYEASQPVEEQRLSREREVTEECDHRGVDAWT